MHYCSKIDTSLCQVIIRKQDDALVYIILMFSIAVAHTALILLVFIVLIQFPINLFCLQIAKEYTDQLTASAIIEMLESFNSYHGLFHYLGGLIAFSEDPDVHFKYIEAAAKTQQLKEVSDTYIFSCKLILCSLLCCAHVPMMINSRASDIFLIDTR